MQAEDCPLQIGLALYRDDVTWSRRLIGSSSYTSARATSSTRAKGGGRLRATSRAIPTRSFTRSMRTRAELRSYWAINDDLLLILGKKGRPRVGNAGLGYLLNRTQ
ncbi:MAG: hypothetical protein R3B51_08735 [Thermodesulfobacteriota bacterium]